MSTKDNGNSIVTIFCDGDISQNFVLWRIYTFLKNATYFLKTPLDISQNNYIYYAMLNLDGPIST